MLARPRIGRENVVDGSRRRRPITGTVVEDGAHRLHDHRKCDAAREKCFGGDLVGRVVDGIIIPPVVPAWRASRTAGKTSSSNGSKSQEKADVKSSGVATPGTRSGHPKASPMGSFMSGGLAWAIVEPSTKVRSEERRVGKECLL